MFAFLKTYLNNIFSYLFIGILIAFIIYFVYKSIYDYGYKEGQNNIQIQWNASKEAYRKEIEQLTLTYQQKEQEYRIKNTEIMQELADVHREYESNISFLTGSYEHKLSQSEHRASIYQRQAESGAIEQRNLASHAARLDKALTEGLELVRELSTTLKFREQQLILLGQQLTNDRKLLNE